MNEKFKRIRKNYKKNGIEIATRFFMFYFLPKNMIDGFINPVHPAGEADPAYPVKCAACLSCLS